MPQVSSKIIYTVEFNEKELATILRALAYMGEVTVIQPRPEDKEIAKALNERLLNVQRSSIAEKMSIIERNRKYAASSKEKKG